ncbi:MAG: FG-GAP repeat domain-containing protein, partial [Gammaproteobacteria bacterium]
MDRSNDTPAAPVTNLARPKPTPLCGVLLAAGMLPALGMHSAQASNVPFTIMPPISTSALGMIEVVPGDIDGDGDLDSVSASLYDDKIAWYQNVNGNGSSWTLHTITLTADAAFSAAVGDLDGDNDLDVASASACDDKIAWYENTNGDGSAWTTHTVSTAAFGAHSVWIADVDGDGVLDLLSASRSDAKIAWYENVNGNGSTWFARTISLLAYSASQVRTGDVDGDGDLDVLSASSADNKIAWYENGDGIGTSWALRTISVTANSARAVDVADVDLDGDLDVLSASRYDDRVAWYENLDGLGTIWTLHTISLAADGSQYLAVGDPDSDGDMDVFVASYRDDRISWFENDGTPSDVTPWTMHTITDQADFAASVAVADIDGDGDIDALSGSVFDDKVGWYRNDTPTVLPTGGLTTTEAGGTASFTVVLNTAPVADVTIPIASADASEGTVSPAALAFTPGGWNVPQTVTVTGVDDNIRDLNVPY